MEVNEKRAALACDVLLELAFATDNFGPMRSAHEGYAILKEEVDELWEEVRKNPAKGPYQDQKQNEKERKKRMREEAIQVAAMAIRFIEDICD